MKTLFLLIARHDAKPVLPLSVVCADYFSHLTPTKFLEKVRAGEIRLPLVRLEQSQKSAKGVALDDLASYLDEQIEAARKDLRQLSVSLRHDQ